MKTLISQKKNDDTFCLGRTFKRLARKLEKRPEEFLTYFDELSAQKLYFSNINLKDYPDIFNHIKLKNLPIDIQFYECNLYSIDIMLHINCSNVKRLCLSRNKIVSSKTLKKIYAPHLQTLAIDKNYIKDFSQTLPYCTWIHSINCIQIESYPQSKTQSETINWFSKIMSAASSNLRLQIRSPDRIKQQIISKLRQTPTEGITIYDKQQMGYLVSDGQSSFNSDDS